MIITEADILLLVSIVLGAGLVAVIILFRYGMGSWFKFWFYRGPVVQVVNPDNTYFMEKCFKLRKSMMAYTHRGVEYIFRAGNNTVYFTTAAPRLYILFAPAEMATSLKLIQWSKDLLKMFNDKFRYTPQNWEQLCIAYYKTYIDDKLATKKISGNSVAGDYREITDVEKKVLTTDKALIKELETGEPRPITDNQGRQVITQEGQLLFYPSILNNIDDKEKLVDRAEDAMLINNTDKFNIWNIDMKDAVLFRRSTFTDNDLQDAYNYGYSTAHEQDRRNTVRIIIIAIAVFLIMIGAAGFFIVLKSEFSFSLTYFHLVANYLLVGR